MEVEEELKKPQLIAVIPKDAHAVIEIRVSDLRKVHRAMAMAQNSKPLVNEADRDAWEYFAGSFFDFIDNTIEGIDAPDGQ